MKLIISLLLLFLIGCTAQQNHDGQNVTEGEQNRRAAKSYLDATEADGKPVNLMNRPFPQQVEEEPKEEPEEEAPEKEEEPKEEDSDSSSSDDSPEIPGEDF